MGVYTMIATADLAFLVGGYLLLRRFRNNPVLGLALPFPMIAGILYMIIFLALIGFGCPDGHWTC